MCYRCSICQAVVGVKQPLRRHIVYHITEWGKDIAQEIPACDGCLRRLQAGVTLEALRKTSATINKVAQTIARQVVAKPKLNYKVVGPRGYKILNRFPS